MVDLIYDDIDIEVNVSFNSEKKDNIQFVDSSQLILNSSPEYVGIGSVTGVLMNESKSVNVYNDGEIVVLKSPSAVGIDGVVLNVGILDRNKPLLNYIDVMHCTVDTVTDHSFNYFLRMDIDSFCQNAIKKEVFTVTTAQDGYVQDYDFWFDSTGVPALFGNNTNNTYVICLIMLYNDRSYDRLWILTLTDDWNVGDDFVTWDSYVGSYTTGLKGYFGFIRANPQYGFLFNAQVGIGMDLSIEEIGYVSSKYASREYRNYTYIPLNCYDTSLFHQKLDQKIVNQ